MRGQVKVGVVVVDVARVIMDMQVCPGIRSLGVRVHGASAHWAALLPPDAGRPGQPGQGVAVVLHKQQVGARQVGQIEEVHERAEHHQ